MENNSVHVQGCPCHLIHIAERLPARIDELLIDIYYYLDKSGKRHKQLKQCQDLCGTEARKILKHVNTRWLSLGKCIDRLLQQWPALVEFCKVNKGPVVTSSELFNDTGSVKLKAGKVSSATNQGTI
ncbi:zinc finger MYM-type protein 6-like [Huso huso]|uniref:Zinc finger MYM-type protein 6-like n=1 Tax=Huso huso TaxID=61971 RepID=A0ABR0ZPQ7_HUSHU